MAAQLWNKALRRPADDYLRMALIENVELAEQMAGSAAKQLWAHHFTQALDALGITWRVGSDLSALDVAAMLQAMRDKWVAWEWQAMDAGTVGAAWPDEANAVRSAPATFSRGFKMFVHQRWFAAAQMKRDSYVMHLSNSEQIRAVAQLRTGSHWLMIDKGRRTKVDGRWVKVDRAARCCAHCATCIEDEMHLLECPTLAVCRARYGIPTFDLGAAHDADMRDIFNPPTRDGWSALGKFLVQCKTKNMQA